MFLFDHESLLKKAIQKYSRDFTIWERITVSSFHHLEIVDSKLVKGFRPLNFVNLSISRTLHQSVRPTPLR
jgi:hypothetical protein